MKNSNQFLKKNHTTNLLNLVRVLSIACGDKIRAELKSGGGSRKSSRGTMGSRRNSNIANVYIFLLFACTEQYARRHQTHLVRIPANKIVRRKSKKGEGPPRRVVSFVEVVSGFAIARPLHENFNDQSCESKGQFPGTPSPVLGST